MIQTNRNDALAPLSPAADALVLPDPTRPLRAAFAMFRRWRELERQRQWLRRLDDRMLRDIGLTRADIERLPPIWRSESPAREF